MSIICAVTLMWVTLVNSGTKLVLLVCQAYLMCKLTRAVDPSRFHVPSGGVVTVHGSLLLSKVSL